MRHRSGPASVAFPLILAIALCTSLQARSHRVAQIPNGQVNGCANCHINAGGGGSRNSFGQSVEASFLSVPGSSGNVVWGSSLAQADADGDGLTNGSELQDSGGVWVIGQSAPGSSSLVTNPGVASSAPSSPSPTEDPAPTTTAPPAEPKAPPEVAVTVDTLDFGAVALGTTASVTFTIDNNGVDPVTTRRITFWGPRASLFDADLTDVTIQPGESAVIEVLFTPEVDGSVESSIGIDFDSDYFEPILTGSGFTPAPRLAVIDSVDLGTTTVGDTLSTHLALRNEGTAPLVVSSLLVPGGGSFSVIDMDSIRIDPGDEALVQVRFSPQLTGELSASLTIHSNDSERPSVEIFLVGKGEEPPPPPLVGDFDIDGDVDLEDFFLFADHYGGPVSGDDAVYDLDADGLLNLLDFFIFADQFGTGVESGGQDDGTP